MEREAEHVRLLEVGRLRFGPVAAAGRALQHGNAFGMTLLATEGGAFIYQRVRETRGG